MFKLDDQRHRHLVFHGLLALTVRMAPFASTWVSQWLVNLDDTNERLDDAIWYCDGSRSLLHGEWKLPMGSLSLASRWLQPFRVVLENSSFPPAVRTDCQAVVTAASEAMASAIHQSRILPRIWM